MILRKVIQHGSSLTVTVDMHIASVFKGKKLLVTCEKNAIVYSTQPIDSREIAIVSLRTITEKDGTTYYGLTIPSKCTEKLGIKKGDKVVVIKYKNYVFIIPYKPLVRTVVEHIVKRVVSIAT